MDIELVVFDWSGTVSDDRKPVYEATVKILKALNKNVMSFEEWLTLTDGSIIKFLNNRGVYEDARILFNMYERYLDEIVSNGVNPIMYPDAFEIFQYLSAKGKKMAILSTHPEKHLRREANEYDLSQFITSLIGSSADKSEDLLNLCEEFNVKPENILFVGDMVSDIQAAKKVGVISVAITTGYHPKELLLAQKPDFIFSNLSDLKTII